MDCTDGTKKNGHHSMHYMIRFYITVNVKHFLRSKLVVMPDIMHSSSSCLVYCALLFGSNAQGDPMNQYGKSGRKMERWVREPWP